MSDTEGHGAGGDRQAHDHADHDHADHEGHADEHEHDEVLVYELEDWTDEQRGALELRLNAEGIEHHWEADTGADVQAGYDPGQDTPVGTDLVVGMHDEERVDAILDELEFPDALEIDAVDDDGGDDEEQYEIMSHLYVAADRLKDDPAELALAGEFFDAADRASASGPPFGVDGDVWKRVQALAAEIATALEAEADDDVVRDTAQQLRDLLFEFV